jgi:hypothetical protein
VILGDEIMMRISIILVISLLTPRVFASQVPSMDDPIQRVDACITNKIVNTKSTDSCRQKSGLTNQAFNERVKAKQSLIQKLQAGAVTCTVVVVTPTGQVRQSIIGGPDHGLLYQMFAHVVSRRGDAVVGFNDCKS